MPVLPPTKSPDSPNAASTGVSSGEPAKTRRTRDRAAVGGFKPDSQRNPRALGVAVAAHLVLGIVLLRAITFETGFRDYFGFGTELPAVQESLTYVETRDDEPPALPEREPEPRVAEAPTAPAVDRGPVLGDAPAAVADAPPRLVAPGRDSAAVNRLPASEAALVGIVPRADDRLWTVADLRALRDEVRAAALVESGGVAGSRELDSVITWVIGSARDSLDSLAVVQGMGPRTANWTKKDSKGGTWGVDPSGIRLGRVTIPSALLAMLPAGAQRGLGGNPTAYERNKSLALAQSDIARFRSAGPGNNTFKMLVEELRERRDRERAARRAGGGATGPVVAPNGQSGGGPGNGRP